MKVLQLTLTFDPMTTLEGDQVGGFIEDFVNRLEGMGYDVEVDWENLSIGYGKNDKVDFIGFNLIINKVGDVALRIRDEVIVNEAEHDLPKNEMWTYLYLTFTGLGWNRMIVHMRWIEGAEEHETPDEVDLPEEPSIWVDILTWIIIALIILCVILWG